MKYSEICGVYEKLSVTSGRLEKTSIVSEFIKKIAKHGNPEWIYLLRGRVLPDYDVREFGISRQIIIKTLSKSFGVLSSEVLSEFNKIGDLGEIAEKFAGKRKQSTLFSSSSLSIDKVFDGLMKIFALEGKGSVDKKVSVVSEILSSASGIEAKYIVRTLLGDLRVGIAESTIKDAIAESLFPEDKKSYAELIESAYDLSNDYAEIFAAAVKGKKEIEKISISPGKPMNVMLAVKAEDIEDAFRICGKPAAIENKYDGFRVVISKKNKEIKLFTRKLEEVTSQFPDIIEVVKKNISGESFILDSEAVGYDPKTKKVKPFESVSQRIKRKHHIERLVKELPVDVHIFDVMYYNGKSVMHLPFSERRKIIEKIIHPEKLKINIAEQIITDNEKRAEEFYKQALKKGEEGIMVKSLSSPYKPGRRVGHMVKLKPSSSEFDLVITGAEHGTGKRAGWLTSYIVACGSEKGFLNIGKVSSGLKEKESEGTTYREMTKLLKPLIKSEKGRVVYVKPKIVVSVTYQNIQKSPSYNSGYALRFPRITFYRPERSTKDIATLEDVKKAVVCTSFHSL